MGFWSAVSLVQLRSLQVPQSCFCDLSFFSRLVGKVGLGLKDIQRGIVLLHELDDSGFLDALYRALHKNVRESLLSSS